MKKVKEGFKLITILLALLVLLSGVFFGSCAYETYRWHTFQQVTHSDIGFWKWYFLFGSK